MPKTQVRRICESDPGDALLKAAEILRAGGLVAIPTETVYGLAADATNASAVAKIYAAKGRPPQNPLIVHVCDVKQARTCASQWPEAAQQMADAFWPGPLTMILPKSERIPEIVTAGGASVGIRVPAHPIAQRLLRAVGVPLAAPSANRSQHLSPTSAEHVLADLDGQIDLILDAGDTPGGIESTVVELTGQPAILRPGPIHQGMLQTVLDAQWSVRPETVDPTKALPSPGMLPRHYAPRTPTMCSVSAAEVVRNWKPADARIGWLAMEGEVLAAPAHTVVVAMPNDSARYAQQLYRELHRLDRMGLDQIVVSLPPEEVEWVAIRDRLARASHS